MKRILFIVFFLGICMFGFKDNPVLKYRSINNRVILREDGAKYQKGIINIKFKSQLTSLSSASFGVPAVDNILLQYNTTKTYSTFTLSRDISKRLPGDDDLAKFYSVKYSANIDPTDLSKIIYEANKDIVEWVEPEFVYDMDYIPNDPSIGTQYHISRINCYQAWDLCKGDTNVVIGICDSGSDLDHPDLAANIKYNYADPENGTDDDANGFTDDFKGWDFYYGDNDPNIMGTGSIHGSHVSGCADQVADNNTHGAGPGFKCKLRISKHAPDVDDNSIYNSNQGLVYLYHFPGVKVINCSFGSTAFSSATQQIVTDAWNAGVVIVASAGNDGQNVPRYPASYTNVVSVAATGSTDLKASFSNWHSTVDVSAPGDNILSTVFNNSYGNLSGTSMSSPITAGTVALIRSKYPSWNAQQVVDRLKLGVDSIDALNPTYAGGLGTGRINAFKCVSDLPIISLVSSSAKDSLYGNNDKVFDVDETVTIQVTYKNTWLAGNNISLRLTTTDPDVQITKDSVYAGNLNAYTTYNTVVTNTFEVKAKPSCPFDKVVTFRLATSNNAYVDNNSNTISMTFRQGWATHNVNNLTLSLTKDGAIGKKTQSYGSGLFLTGYSQVNNVLESGLMIGNSNTKVSDDCRRGSAPTNQSDTDFTPLMSYSMTTPGILSNQDGFGLFNDNGAGVNKIGVTVRAQSFAWTASQDANYIILRYSIRNTSGSNLTNIYAGVYSYFTPGGQTSSNITSLDTLSKLGYTYNTGTPDPYLGIGLLTSQNLNFKALNGTEVLNGFTSQEKWDALSSGISVPSQGPGTNCMVVSAGPFNINNNDSVIVAFAVVKGTNLTDIKTNINTAKNKYGLIGVQQISEIVPNKFSLFQNYPNPFNPSTTIKFDIAKDDFVKIKVFDVLGREVANPVNQQMKPGTYNFTFDASNYASGIYFYKIETGSFADIKKMILVK